MTLDVAEIDAGSNIFECGQTYVALSRVKSLHGLYLTSFDASRIRINKKVKEFYDSLTLYHETKETNEEVYVPVVVAEPILQEEAELVTKADVDTIPIADAKVISIDL
jgi:hypothetical protein